MALVNCPECNESISQKASVCPHCGYPMKPEKEATQYELQTGFASDSRGAAFMRVIAWMIWIGGLVLAIVFSIGSEAYGRYSARNAFNWGTFFAIFGSCAISGGLAWSVALLFEDVHGIFQVMSTLKLVEKEKPTTKTESSTVNKWKCQKCGTMNDKSRLYCWGCGAYKD